MSELLKELEITGAPEGVLFEIIPSKGDLPVPSRIRATEGVEVRSVTDEDVFSELGFSSKPAEPVKTEAKKPVHQDHFDF